uniref:Uncharacterized protein n=1 Tax=Staphylococcus phage 184DA TaxID=3110532 RepID=A0AAU6MX74_9CAUD
MYKSIDFRNFFYFILLLYKKNYTNIIHKVHYIKICSDCQ